jgi:peptide deformylase
MRLFILSYGHSILKERCKDITASYPDLEALINARILRQSELTWTEEEGCLSIPNMTQQVSRPWAVEIEYFPARHPMKYLKKL